MIIILVIGAIALAWGSLDGPAARQRIGMEAAHVVETQLKPRIAADPRFASVYIGVSTHPALFVRGYVPDERALQDLKAIVVVPPDDRYRLLFHVEINETAATRPAE